MTSQDNLDGIAKGTTTDSSVKVGLLVWVVEQVREELGVEQTLQALMYVCKVCKRPFDHLPLLSTHLQSQHQLVMAHGKSVSSSFVLFSLWLLFACVRYSVRIFLSISVTYGSLY